MDHGWDGVAIIAPFACLPGRLIEALYAPWSRERGIPVISLENDGNPDPPNVISRIEIFAAAPGTRVFDDVATDGASMPIVVIDGLVQIRDSSVPDPIVDTPSSRPDSARSRASS